MTARILATTTVLALAAGCTILNQPDDGLLDGSTRSDAAGMDGGMNDARVDGGRDAGPPVRETDCDDGLDNDGDDRIDCSDFDCAGADTCCSDEHPPRESQVWSDTTGWTPVPSADPPSIRTGGGQITDFGLGTHPKALVRQFCSPVATGITIDAILEPVGDDPRCSSMECYGALVLSSANDMAVTSKLLDELAVRLVLPIGGDPEVRATRNDASIATHTVPGTDPVYVEIDLGPTLDEMGQPSVAATVWLKDSPSGSSLTGDTPFLEQHVVMPQRLLISDAAGCAANPGLFVAVEGNGGSVHVGEVGLTERSCANPSQFRVPSAESAILTSDRNAAGYASLGFTPWASGGIAHPAIVSTRFMTSMSRWDVFVDGTDVERSQDVGIWDLGFAIGHTTANGIGWNSAWADTGSEPRIGDCHPSCVGMAGCGSSCGTTGRRGLREPTAFPIVSATTGAILSLQLAYAVEDTSDPARPFSIALHSTVPSNPTSGAGSPVFTVDPDDVGCVSLREPSLVPAQDATTPEGWWLFYTCERSMAAPAIGAMPLGPALEPMAGSAEIILEGSAFGTIASGGIRSPEVLVSFPREGDVFFRVWATAIQGSTRRIVLATTETSGDLPGPGELTPYPENPVLTLDDMPPCPGDWCELLGMAVTRRADQVDTLRFLVAWHVNSASSGREYQLVPLEQIWK